MARMSCPSLVPSVKLRFHVHGGSQAGPKRISSFFLGRPDMGKKLYVGNLTYDVTDSTLAQLFEGHGTVQSAQVIMDRDLGRSKGFGFVEMGSDAEAQAAIQALNEIGRASCRERV